MALIDATKKKNKSPVQTPAQIAQGQKVAAILAAAGAGGQGAEGEWGILNDSEAKSAGLVTDRNALLATVPKGSDGNVPQTLGDIVLRGASSRTTPASVTTAALTSSRGIAPSVAGKTANSAGSFYGSAGTNTTGTSFGTQSTGTRIDRTAGISQDPMSEYINLLSPQAAIDRQEQIRKDLARERQQQIDAIEMSARQSVSREQEAGAQDLARQRSMNLRSGLGGSDFGAANKAEIRTRTNQNVQGIEAQRDMAIGGAIDKIEQIAQSRFQIEQNALQQGFGNLMQVQEYIQAQEQQMRAQTLDSLKTLGQSGMDIQTIKQRDPDLYEKLTVASGMSEVEVEAVLNNAKPAPERTDYQYKVMGNKLIAFGVDPMTGQLKTMEQEVDMPDNYSVTTMPDGTVLGIPAEWDGDTSKIVTVGNYRMPFASEMGGGVGGAGVPTGDITTNMTTQQRSAFNSIVDKYNKSPLVAAADRTIVLKDSIKNIKNDPSNGTLQLNLVYSYIQALDTYQSAVREGELSLVNSIDSKVGQIGQYVQKIQNGQIVRPDVALQIADAADKVISTINEGAKRKQQQFKSQANVNGIGEQWDTYIGGYQTDAGNPGVRSIVDSAGYDYDSMKADGLSDDEILGAIEQTQQRSIDNTLRMVFPASSLFTK